MVLISAVWIGVAGSAQAAHYEVILLGGQSNMDGRAEASDLPLSLQSPQDDVLFYEGGSLRTLRPDSGTDFGPEITFGRTIADARPLSEFALIKYAVGGTSLSSDWDPDTGGTYASFKNTVTAGLAALSNGGVNTYEITGMLWAQGESDAINGRTTVEYQVDLNAFIADVRTDYVSDLPFFISRLPGLSDVRTAQENVALADAQAYLIDTDGFDMSDALHFSADGQQDLGEAFATSYLAAAPEPGSLILLGLGSLFVMNHRRRSAD